MRLARDGSLCWTDAPFTTTVRALPRPGVAVARIADRATAQKKTKQLPMKEFLYALAGKCTKVAR